jgi:hypothetical protein
MALTLKEADLGDAPVSTTLSFSVSSAKGFSADAMLDCELKHVGSWESVELAGKTVEEDLVPKGLYTLQISIAFRSKQESTADLDFEILEDGAQLKKKKLSFSGKSKDVGRAIVFVNII